MDNVINLEPKLQLEEETSIRPAPHFVDKRRLEYVLDSRIFSKFKLNEQEKENITSLFVNSEGKYEDKITHVHQMMNMTQKDMDDFLKYQKLTDQQVIVESTKIDFEETKQKTLGTHPLYETNHN